METGAPRYEDMLHWGSVSEWVRERDLKRSTTQLIVDYFLLKIRRTALERKYFRARGPSSNGQGTGWPEIIAPSVIHENWLTWTSATDWIMIFGTPLGCVFGDVLSQQSYPKNYTKFDWYNSSSYSIIPEFYSSFGGSCSISIKRYRVSDKRR